MYYFVYFLKHIYGYSYEMENLHLKNSLEGNICMLVKVEVETILSPVPNTGSNTDTRRVNMFRK